MWSGKQPSKHNAIVKDAVESFNPFKRKRRSESEEEDRLDRRRREASRNSREQSSKSGRNIEDQKIELAAQTSNTEEESTQIGDISVKNAPRGFKQSNCELGQRVAGTFGTEEESTLDQIRKMKDMIRETNECESIDKQKECYETLCQDGELTQNSSLSRNSIENFGTAVKLWGKFAQTTNIRSVLPLVPEVGDPTRKDVLLYIRRTYLGFASFAMTMIKPKDGVLAAPKTARDYAMHVAKCHQRLGIDHCDEILDTLKLWKKGAERRCLQMRGPRQKMKKCAFSSEQIRSWFEHDALLQAKQGLGHLYGTMIQTVVQVGYRRSEYTDAGRGFNRKIDLTRGHLKWWIRQEEGEDQQVPPTVKNLKKLMKLKASNLVYATLRPPVLKNDQFGSIWGEFSTPLPLNQEDICAARWLLEMEILNPIADMEARLSEPLFRDPTTGRLITVGKFDTYIRRLVKEEYARRGVRLSDQQARSLYSLHSFRITATNLLAALGCPPHIRRMLGRWSSESGMSSYTREELNQMLYYMEKQGKAKLKMFQMNKVSQDITFPDGVESGGAIIGVSRGEAFDAIPWGPVEIQTECRAEADGTTLRRLDLKSGEMVDIFDAEGHAEMEDDDFENIATLGNKLDKLGFRQQHGTIENLFDQFAFKASESVEPEEESIEPFSIPEGYNCVEKIEQLNGTLIDSQIIKYIEGFGWGHGRIKSFNAKWKYPFTIKWVDEPHPRKHLLRVEEYTSMERISYPKPGDFMILSKESKEG